MNRNAFLLVLTLCACARPGLPSCTTCAPARDDGLDDLARDPRVSAARARQSAYVQAATGARREAEGATGEAHDEAVMTARLYLLAAIVEEERRALTPAVTPEARLEVPRDERLEAAREDARTIAIRTLEEATIDEERRLAATARDRRSARSQAAVALTTAIDEALARAGASLDAAHAEGFRARLAAARAERDLDARYVALDTLAIDLREALRSLVP